MLLLLAVACSGGSSTPLAEGARVWVEARHVEEGQPVRLHAPAGTRLPVVAGLTATELSTEENGFDVWELRGESGSYVVDVPVGGDAVARVFLDIGVEGPTGGPMEDLVSIPAPPPPLWPRVAALVSAVGTLLVLAAFAWHRLRVAPLPPVPEPADHIARRAWAAVRAREDLDPGALATELSAIYRRYLEAVHAWPATSRTSREILDALAGDLPAVQLERARRLLNAMDIVRFSERSTHEGFFSRLDDDFEALLSVRVGAPHA